MPGTIIIPPSVHSQSPPSPSVVSPIKSSLSSPSPIQISSDPSISHPALDDDAPHRYIPPTADCSRAPCPALNALANHGYLPRSGRQITFHDIMTSLEEGFGLSRSFGLFMAVGSFTLLKRSPTHPFDLHETAVHNLIEHNASLVHDDADPNQVNCEGVEYAPVKVDPVLMHRFLKIACPLHKGGEDVYTTSIIAQYRVARENETKVPLDALHAELGRAEFSMVIQIFGKPDENGNWYVDENTVAEFFNNRLPEGWKPTRTLHLIDAFKCTNDIRHEMAAIRKSQPPLDADEANKQEWFCRAKKWFHDLLSMQCDP